MKKLHIIGTGHFENGKTTTLDLVKYIEKLNPDVIYEEVPLNLFNDIYINNRIQKTTESKAIEIYINKNSTTTNIPVDIDNLREINSYLKCGVYDDEIDDFIYKNSGYLAEKVLKQINFLDEQGYETINSFKHYILVSFYQRIVKSKLYNKNRELFYKSKISDSFHFQIREYYMINEILKTIYNYKNPLLIVGYYHLPTIRKKIRKQLTGITPVIFK